MILSFFDNAKVGEVPQKVKDVYVEKPEGIKVEIWQQNLEIPWSLVFLPNGDALVSERPGRIRIIQNGTLKEDVYANIPNVMHSKGSEAGLMGIALHPNFASQPYVYAMYTFQEGNVNDNRVIRLKHNGSNATFDKIIVDGIPAGRNHNGGRIKFGPDGMLYITAGETFERELAQDMESLGGKILRVTPDGAVPNDNPFPGSIIYSLGHRNPQGLAWHPETGDLFSSEHGPSGEMRLTGNDIINIIKPGKNYGWPKVVGKVNMKEFEDPIIMWEAATPPSGMVFWNNNLYVTTLRSKALMHIQMNKTGDDYEITRIERWFSPKQNEGVYGRFRDVTVGPDGDMYVLTNNRDGRGNPTENDDRILRISKMVAGS
ncbi:MAG: PQQ-dependent sugar dehydrogenase [Bacteroidetes bacterium]|nr:PQQ-dependent sugar dehydrogenase [Bacteroidota bacterium]